MTWLQLCWKLSCRFLLCVSCWLGAVSTLFHSSCCESGFQALTLQHSINHRFVLLSNQRSSTQAFKSTSSCCSTLHDISQQHFAPNHFVSASLDFLLNLTEIKTTERLLCRHFKETAGHSLSWESFTQTMSLHWKNGKGEVEIQNKQPTPPLTSLYLRGERFEVTIKTIEMEKYFFNCTDSAQFVFRYSTDSMTSALLCWPVELPVQILLFILYINELEKHILNADIHFNADDTVIYCFCTYAHRSVCIHAECL